MISWSRLLRPNRTKMALQHLPRRMLKKRKKNLMKNRSFSITSEHNFRPTINKSTGKEALKDNMSKGSNIISWSKEKVITSRDWQMFSTRMRMIKPTFTDQADISQLPIWLGSISARMVSWMNNSQKMKSYKSQENSLRPRKKTSITIKFRKHWGASELKTYQF